MFEQSPLEYLDPNVETVRAHFNWRAWSEDLASDGAGVEKDQEAHKAPNC